jgi:hypothetical protein
MEHITVLSPPDLLLMYIIVNCRIQMDFSNPLERRAFINNIVL